MVSYCPTKCKIHKFYVLPTLCIYVFYMELRKKNSDYFPVQHKLVSLYNPYIVCLLCLLLHMKCVRAYGLQLIKLFEQTIVSREFHVQCLCELSFSPLYPISGLFRPKKVFSSTHFFVRRVCISHF